MNKRIRKSLSAVAALLCLICLLGPAAHAAPGQATLTVKQVCRAGASDSGAFTYRLTPEQASNPMPAGSGPDGYTLALTGTTAGGIGPISFTQAGIYAYRLSPVKSCACALESYNLKIYVESDLKISVVATKPNGAKAMELQFEHSCGEETTTTPPPTTKPPATDENGPKTGDDSQAGLYIAMFSAAGVMLLGCIIYFVIGRRRKARRADSAPR